MLSAEALEVVEIARAAGRRILARYGRSSLAVSDKLDGSPVTDADLAADAEIRERLSARFELPIVSEESEPPSAEELRAWPEWWLVDPLDGTRDFVAGTDEFCVCIARVFAGAPELGVIYAPVTGISYAAERGAGAWRFPRDGSGPTRLACPAREGPITALRSRFHSSAKGEAFVRMLGASALVEMGSALKFAAVAEGRADLFASIGGAKLWDLAAGQVIAEEAGARVLSIDTRLPPRFGADAANLSAGPFVVLGPRLDARALDGLEYASP